MLRFLRISIEVLLIGILAFTCLALGGTPTWTWLVVEIATATVVILWMLRMIVERRLRYAKTLLNVLLLLLLLLVFLQLVPLPAALVRRFQPGTLRLHTVGPPNVPEAASQPLTGGASFPLSLNRARTRGHLFLYAAYVAFFVVLINNIRSRQQLGRMLGAVLAVGAVVAISGFATARQDDRLLYRRYPMGSSNERPGFLNFEANPEFSAGYGFVFALQEGDRVDWYVPKTHGGDVFGGFPSSNSAATVLAMTLIVSLGIFFAYFSTRRAEWGGSGGLLYTREGNITLLVLFNLVLLLCALGLTKSRGGILAAALLIPVLLTMVGFSRSLLAGILTVVVIVLLVLVPVAVAGPSRTADFIGGQANAWLNPWQEEIRLLGREATWRILGDYPLFGTGLGTFCSIYPSYKIRGPMLYFTHCDSLQWAAEMGLVGTILAGAILVTGVATVIVGWFRLKDPFFRRLLLGCSLGCVAFLVHGLADFPLQIPGVTILFVTLAGVCVVVARDMIARHEESEFSF